MGICLQIVLLFAHRRNERTNQGFSSGVCEGSADSALPAQSNSSASTGGRTRQGEPGSRFRHFVFTWNNPPDLGYDEQGGVRRALQSLGTSWFLFQPEVGEQGTVHLQGALSFSSARSFRAIATAIPGWHIERMRGTIDQAVEYCTKEESRHADHSGIVEVGTRPRNAGRAGGRSDLDGVVTLIKSGAGVKRVADECPEEFIKYYRGIERSIQVRTCQRDFKTTVHWYYGPTGTGKSRAACAEAPDAYWKDPSHHWWDGYEYQDDIIVDDYRPDFCKFAALLRLFDRYPFQVQVKGGTRSFLAKRIFITAPKRPEEFWENRTSEDLAQLLRRIEVIKHFPNSVFNPSL